MTSIHHFDFAGPAAAAGAGQPWTATTHSLNALREWGVDASLIDGTPPDPRMADAIEAIRAARQADGSWLQARRHPGRVWFEVDVPAGQPSKWLTLYGTRVLAWWDACQP